MAESSEDSPVKCDKIGEHEAAAREELMPLIYGELRRMAAHLMGTERADHTLTPTALVHEVYLRISGTPVDDQAYASRSHFFSAAAMAMRRVLVDSARKKRALKRGGDKDFVTLDEGLIGGKSNQDVAALDDALCELAIAHPDLAELVSMRYFAGMTMAQSAKVLGIPLRTSERNWHFARAWLKTQLSD